MRAPRLLLAMPAYVINGIGVALGVALIQLSVTACCGSGAALAASSGAIVASLADVPSTPGRVWRRVLMGALMGCATSLIVAALRPYPLLLGVATALLAFAATLTFAWGLRATPISFVPILALVFTMAAPPAHGLAPLLQHAGWTILGAALYLAWAIAAALLLQRHYCTLATTAALQAMAQLLRSRARLFAAEPSAAAASLPLSGWIESQAALDERLQAARDFLFAAPDTLEANRQIAVLLLAIDMRDTLLASELDLDLLGRDAAAELFRGPLAANMNHIAHGLERISAQLRFGDDDSVRERAGTAPLALAKAAIAALDATRAHLAAALLLRAQHMADDLARMQAAMQATAVQLPLARAELQLFVSPESWPLAALRKQLRFSSPVLRHALRAATALGSAYFIAQALPWASHPHWVVLSVAVVLRGNLEQTLARRDARVAGTVIGCLLVLLLAKIGTHWLIALVFIAAVGMAHAFVTKRYLVTAAAASVMALLQAHLTQPESGFGVGERLIDTVLGALLAWAFSYLLPSWEQRSVTRLTGRVLLALSTLAGEALRRPEGATPELALRLARREVYEAIGSIAATAQRTGVEPRNVRVPLDALAALLVRAHVLLAQLAAIRTLLMRSAAALPHPEAEAALQAACAEVRRLLDPKAAFGEVDADAPTQDDETLAPPADTAQMPWLERHLQLTVKAAAGVAQAARTLRSAAGAAGAQATALPTQ